MVAKPHPFIQPVCCRVVDHHTQKRRLVALQLATDQRCHQPARELPAAMVGVGAHGAAPTGRRRARPAVAVEAFTRLAMGRQRIEVRRRRIGKPDQREEARSVSTRFAGPDGKLQPEGAIFFAAPRAYFDAANVCITIFPLRTTKVSVANGNHGLASHTM